MSSYFGKNIFASPKVACELYLLANNWMIATGKELPEILLKIKLNIDNQTQLYFIIKGIIEELLCTCYFDNIENLTEAIITREFCWDMQAYDYCQDLITKAKNFFEVSIDFDNNKKKLLGYTKK